MKPKSNPFLRYASLAASVVLTLGLAQQHASAVSATWGADAGEQWATGAAWVGGTAAGSASAANTDIATFDGAGNYVVGLNGGSVQRHIGTIDITNTGTTTFNNGGYLYVYDTIKMSATAGAVNIGGNLRLNGTTANTITNDNTASLLTISAATGRSVAGSATVTVGGAGNTTITGNIAPASGSLAFTKVGAGALTLAGNNTFAGGVTLKQGTININTNNSALGTGTFQIGDSTGTTAVTLDSLSARSITNALSLYQDFTYTGTNTLGQGTGAITLATNGTTGNRIITVSASTLTLGGNIGDGGGGYSITKNGAGTLVLSGTGNTYGGGTTVSVGTLRATNSGALSGFGSASKVSVANNATLVLNYGGASDWTITNLDSLLSANGVGFASGSTLALDTANGGGSYASNITVANLGLTKLGTNTLTLSGTASTYTGATAINAGSLQIDNAGALGSTSGITVSASNNSALVLNSVTVAAGKPLTISGPGVSALYGSLSTATTNVSSEWQGSITIGATTLTRIGSQSGILKVSGNIGETTSGSELIVRNNGGVTVLSGANTFSGNLSILTGTLRVGGNTTVDGSNNIISAPLGKGSLVAANTSAALTAEGSTARTIYNPVTFTSNNSLAIGAATTDTGKLTFRGAFTRTGNNVVTTNSDVEFAGGATSSTLYRLDINNGTTTISSGTYGLSSYFTVNTVVTGPANYVQTGGTFNLNLGAYVGNVASSTSTFTVSGGAFNVNNSEGLIMRDNGTATSTVSGAGQLSSTGTGGLSFQKSGSTGTFNLGDGTTFSGGSSINDGGTSGVFTASKVVRTAGNSTNNIFNFNGGTLKASAATFTFADNTNIAANVMAGGGIIDNGNFDITIGQNLLHGTGASADGGMVFKGTGKTTLTGVGSTYNGATTVTDGKLVVNGNISTSTTTVKTGAAIGGSGTVGALTIENGGTLAPGTSPGTISVSGNLGLNNASILDFELNPLNTTTGSTINDLVAITGGLTLDGLLRVTATSGNFLAATNGTKWTLFTYTGSLTNSTLSFDTGFMPDLGSGLAWSIDTATTGQVNLVVIPEPRAALLGGIGLLVRLRRRR